jgi:hypothetical protein
MLTVKQLFKADGLDIAEDQIKLVRHVDHLTPCPPLVWRTERLLA